MSPIYVSSFIVDMNLF